MPPNLIVSVVALLVATVGLAIAFWRSSIAAKQADTAERGLNNERYQKSGEMLASDMLATRICGVAALEMLAHEHQREYRIQVINLLCGFARHPKTDSNPDGSSGTGDSIATVQSEPEADRHDDVEAAAQVIGRLNNRQATAELSKDLRFDLSFADFSNMRLTDANFSNTILYKTNLADSTLGGANFSAAVLTGTNLSGAILDRANLSDTDITGTDLSDAVLIDAEFSNSFLKDANLSGTRIVSPRNFTQDQLDGTFIWKGTSPPELEGAADGETGKQLKWEGEMKDPSEYL